MSYLQRRLIVSLTPDRDKVVISPDQAIPLIIEIGIDINRLTHMVSIGMNRLLIISHDDLGNYQNKKMKTKNGTSVETRHPGQKTQTINVYNMNTDWDDSVVLDKLRAYLDGEITVRMGSVRGYPNLMNGIRHIKATTISDRIPRALVIEGKTIKIRFPGETLRDRRCYSCGADGHNAADCPNKENTVAELHTLMKPSYAAAVSTHKDGDSSNLYEEGPLPLPTPVELIADSPMKTSTPTRAPEELWVEIESKKKSRKSSVKHSPKKRECTQSFELTPSAHRTKSKSEKKHTKSVLAQETGAAAAPSCPTRSPEKGHKTRDVRPKVIRTEHRARSHSLDRSSKHTHVSSRSVHVVQGGAISPISPDLQRPPKRKKEDQLIPGICEDKNVLTIT